MRQIRSKGTKPEVRVRQLVHQMGFRFRLHSARLPGKPDLVFAKLKCIIDVRGCFWHQHKNCIDAHVPKSGTAYWRPKLRSNVARDERNLRELRALGWRVLTVWECETAESKHLRLRQKLARFLKA